MDFGLIMIYGIMGGGIISFGMLTYAVLIGCIGI